MNWKKIFFVFTLFTWFAFDPGVPVVAERTRTMCHSVGNPALSVRSASSLLQTRVPARFIGATPFVRLAVIVLGASVPNALDIRFTLEPVRARTNGPVLDSAAL